MKKPTSKQVKRCKHEIVMDILSLCRTAELKTKIMYRSNLSYELTAKYLKELEDKGFLSRTGKSYITTPLGKDILEGLESLYLVFENKELPRPLIYV